MITPPSTNMEIFDFRIAELTHVVGALGLLWLLRYLLPYLGRSWQDRDYKGLAVASSLVSVAVAAIWFVVLPLIPPSDRTVHREGIHLGLAEVCKRSPRYMDCRSSDNCTVCKSRAGCLEAVDKYADKCFNGLYERWAMISRHDFDVLLYDCINDRSGCGYFYYEEGKCEICVP
jgi:hypothetical protein